MVHPFFVVLLVELNDKKVVEFNQTIEIECQKIFWYRIIYIFVPLLCKS